MSNPQYGWPAPPPPKRKRWPLVAAGVLAALFAIGAVASATGTPTRAPSGPLVAPVAAPEVPVAAQAAGPLTTFGEGTWEVGVDIAPGKYKTTGTSGFGCYYARLKTGDGRIGDIIDNNISQGPATVTIKPTDGLFETNGCAAWVKAP